MIESLKNNWRELARGSPGERFQNRYKKKQRSGSSGTGRMLKRVAAGLLIAAGIVLLVIPGPGSVLIVLGAALLAEESLSIARGLDWTEMRIRRLLRRG